MVALRRRDVADLNERARAQMKTAGALGLDEVVAGPRAFAAGDGVAITTNDRILDVTNGQRGQVVAVDIATRSVSVRLGAREVDLPARYLDAGSLDHGYAMIAHRLQGATVDRTHVLGSDELYREWGYTALSRHRETAHFYVTAAEVQEPLPGMDEHDALDDTIASLRREKAKSMATDLADNDLGATNTSDLERAARLAARGPARSAGRHTATRSRDRRTRGSQQQARCHRSGVDRDWPVQPPTTCGA